MSSVTLQANLSALPKWTKFLEEHPTIKKVLSYSFYQAASVMNNCGMVSLTSPSVNGPYVAEMSKEIQQLLREPEVFADYADQLANWVARTMPKYFYCFSDVINTNRALNWAEIAEHLPGAVTYGPVVDNPVHPGNMIQAFLWAPPSCIAYSLGAVTLNDGKVVERALKAEQQYRSLLLTRNAK